MTPPSKVSRLHKKITSGFPITSTLPTDVHGESMVRLLSFVVAIGLMDFVGIILNAKGVVWFGWDEQCAHVGVGIAASGLALSVLMVHAIKSKRYTARVLNMMGLLYLVVSAFGLAFSEQVMPESRMSVVTLLILIYPLFVPSPPHRVLAAGLASAAMYLLAAFIYRHNLGDGSTIWTTNTTMTTIANVLTAFIATIPSKVMRKMVAELSKARQLGAYQLTHRLGIGGMGEVWAAQHKLLRRPAAVKLIRKDQHQMGSTARFQEWAQRFEREAQVTAELTSPHTIGLFDFGVSGSGDLFYVMELLAGMNLETFVKRFGPVDPPRAAFILSQVCESLGEAHARGVIHRDIKPSNVFLTRRGRRDDFVKVLDFGLVKSLADDNADDVTVTRDGAVAGTPAYMAPETALEGVADTRSDIYAVGCLAFFLLTGDLLFDASTPTAMAVAHATKEPDPPSTRTELEVTPELDDVIMLCLRKNPADRPGTAYALADQLLAAIPNPWTAERASEWWELHAPDAFDHPEVSQDDALLDTVTVTHAQT